jgi:hypothetical protein
LTATNTESPAPSKTITHTLEPTETSVPTSTPTPLPPDFPIPGIEIHWISEIDLVEDTGVSWVRRNALLWSHVEPFEGNRNWDVLSSLEEEMIDVSIRDMEMILIVRSTPAWAQKAPGYACGPIREQNLDDFGEFMFDVVSRYSYPPYNVTYWELGNEPDVATGVVASDSVYGCWGDRNDQEYYGGEYYAEMLKIVYPRIKAANPEVKVLVGGLLLDCDPNNPPEFPPDSGKIKDCTTSRFLEGILENDGGDSFDGISFHAYDYYNNFVGEYSNLNWHSSWDSTGPVMIPKLDYLNNLLLDYGYANKILMNTETALLCGRTGNEPYCFVEDFSDTKAAYLAQTYTLARTQNLTTNIWYDLYGWRASGLLDGYGQPLPAYDALRINTQQLSNAAYINEIYDYPGVRVFEFYLDGVNLWVVWSIDGKSHHIEFSSKPNVIYDMTGGVIESDNGVNIDFKPIYIVWHPAPN